MNRRNELMEETRNLVRRRKRSKINVRTLKRAIGVSDGKELTIANECASASIQLRELVHLEHNLKRKVIVYDVSGDVDEDKRFDDLPSALAYAIAGIALYMDGSPNR